MRTTLESSLALAAGLIAALLSSRAASAQNVAPPPVIDIPQCNGYRLQSDDRLTAKQRACIWGGNLLTPGAIFGAAFSSGYGFLTKEEPAWGQGTAGYAKLFGARYAQGDCGEVRHAEAWRCEGHADVRVPDAHAKEEIFLLRPVLE